MDDVRAVMDAVGAERAVVLGVSEGGPMCALFAATYPERTRGARADGLLRAPATGRRTTRSAAARRRTPGRPTAEHWGLSAARRFLDGAGAVASPATRRRSSGTRPTSSAAPASARWRSDHRHERGDRRPRTYCPRSTCRRSSSTASRSTCGGQPLHGRAHPRRADRRARRAPTICRGRAIRRRARRDPATSSATLADDAGRTRARAHHRARGRSSRQSEHRSCRRARALPRPAAGCPARQASAPRFDGPARAVRCAHRARRIAPDPARRRAHGRVRAADGRLVGPALEVAAGVAARRGAGEILTTSAVQDLVAGSGIEFAERGAFALPLAGASREWRLFSVER